MFLTHQSVQFRKALSVQVSHRFAAGSAVFDEDNLVSCAGLVPVMTLAEQTGLPQLFAEKVSHHDAADQVRGGQPGPEAGHA